jgi:hypothetical protein
VVLTVAVNIGTVTIGDIYIGESKLTKATHYTESDGEITIKKETLDDLEKGDHVIKVETDQGVVTAVITVEDTTALEIEPETATFDKNSENPEGYVDLEFEIKHNTTGVTLASVYNGDTELTPTEHYTADGLVVTILKTYLDDLEKGDVTITFKTNKGDVDAVITIEDTTELG